MSHFIWTECFGCPTIGAIAIKSFLHYHPSLVLNVFCYEDDTKYLPASSNIIYHVPTHSNNIQYYVNQCLSFVSSEYPLCSTTLKKSFQKGHKGTAHLWSRILKSFSSYDALIHFDSDVIFCGPAIDLLIDASSDYDVVGQCRPYKYNQNLNESVRNLPDLVQTCCFLFKPALASSISRLSQQRLSSSILGKFRSSGHTLLDFFDQLSFEMLRNGANFRFISVDDFGGTSSFGSRYSNFSKYNDFPTPNKIDIGKYLIHFSAVGSGHNIWKTGASSGASTYDAYAIDRFLLYMDCFYNGFSCNLTYDSEPYKDLINHVRSLDALHFLWQ